MHGQKEEELANLSSNCVMLFNVKLCLCLAQAMFGLCHSFSEVVCTLFYALWDCFMILPLWKAVLEIFKMWLKRTLPLSPQ